MRRSRNCGRKKPACSRSSRTWTDSKTRRDALQTQIDVIEGLQKNRTGAQELLQMVANTVVRVDQLWLTSLDRKGDALSIGGEAGNINSVANFMTQLKRSGYFDKIEIQEAKEDDVVKSVTTYGFTMTASVAQTPHDAGAASANQADGGRNPAPGTCGEGKELAMATGFRDWPWPLQALFFLGLAVVLIAAGMYLPFLPNASIRTQLEAAQATEKPLQTEVAGLRVYKQRRAELASQMDALEKQLATLQTIVPEDKQTDQFIIMIQSAAVSSGVAIRRMKALAHCQQAVLL